MPVQVHPPSNLKAQNSFPILSFATIGKSGSSHPGDKFVQAVSEGVAVVRLVFFQPFIKL
jgi:hypothetical protein